MNKKQETAMTPSEKAKQLLWKYLPILEGWTDEGKTQTVWAGEYIYKGNEL